MADTDTDTNTAADTEPTEPREPSTEQFLTFAVTIGIPNDLDDSTDPKEYAGQMLLDALSVYGIALGGIVHLADGLPG